MLKINKKQGLEDNWRNPAETIQLPLRWSHHSSSTLHPLAEITRRSAGVRSPPLISTRSPSTTSSALICIFSPSRITIACCHEGKGREMKQMSDKEMESFVVFVFVFFAWIGFKSNKDRGAIWRRGTGRCLGVWKAGIMEEKRGMTGRKKTQEGSEKSLNRLKN